MNAHAQFPETPPNHLANKYAGECGKLHAHLTYAEIALRIGLEVQTTGPGLRKSVKETLAYIQRALAEAR